MVIAIPYTSHSNNTPVDYKIQHVYANKIQFLPSPSEDFTFHSHIISNDMHRYAYVSSPKIVVFVVTSQ
jgi:hypothetical protein